MLMRQSIETGIKKISVEDLSRSGIKIPTQKEIVD